MHTIVSLNTNNTKQLNNHHQQYVSNPLATQSGLFETLETQLCAF